MTTLNIDIETYSSFDLKQCGLYRYVEAPDFEILLFAYAFDDEPVEIVDLAQFEELPDEVKVALLDPSVTLSAFNAAFEMTCINKFFGYGIEPERWHCTMIHSFMMGLPGSLDGVAKALKLDVQKDSTGKALIRYFSIPCKPTKANGGRTRNLPEHDAQKWEQFKSYCCQDVEVERSISGKVSRYKIPQFEKDLWCLDQRINLKGARVDKKLVMNAIKGNELYKERLLAEAVKLTGLDNPNSGAQLKAWLSEAEGKEISSLTKETVPALLKDTDNDRVARVLELRQELSKTSISKYEAMSRGMCDDNRVRGMLQFYGANRTGRWAGRLVQIQNLPRTYLHDLELARELVRDGDFDDVELLFRSLPDTLSQLIRTAFVAERGKRYIVADFSAIEARVLAWLAGEKWVLDVFNTHGKIYEQTASRMYGVPLERIVKGNDEYELRQKGKTAVLACGYQGGPHALIAMGALRDGIKESELPGIISAWRKANPHIVRFWKDVEDAALIAVDERGTSVIAHNIAFSASPDVLYLTLPSGRKLSYMRPRLEKDPRFNNKVGLTYEGYGDGRWTRVRTYGGKLVENMTQAVARDCLAYAMLNVDKAGYPIVFHVHDEIVCEVDDGIGSLDDVIKIMSTPIPWAKGLPLNAAGFEGRFYKKD